LKSIKALTSQNLLKKLYNYILLYSDSNIKHENYIKGE